jgi:signal transduction histidine kinase
MSVTSPTLSSTIVDEAPAEGEASHRSRDERLRIARELHDVIGYGFATINVQAGVAAHMLESQPARAAAALRAIQTASAEALGELRTILGLLRETSGDRTEPATPGLARLDELGARMSAAGVPTRITVVGTPRQLPHEVDLAAFRIAQESLANVLHHAGPARASVVVTYERRRLMIEVTDDGGGPTRRPADAGRVSHGIVGMSERVAAIGGALEAGARPEGGFRVRAVLPLGPRP